MNNTYSFALNHDEVLQCFKSKYRKDYAVLLVAAVIFTVLTAVFALCCIFVDEAGLLSLFLIFTACVAAFMWTRYILICRAVVKIAEKFFSFNNADGTVEYDFAVEEKEVVVTQPQKGNVVRINYGKIQSIIEVNGYVLVNYAADQFLPIVVNDATADLVYELKARTNL